jgi:hypothetical protein
VIHVVSLELAAGLDIEIGWSLLCIAMLIRHYQLVWSDLAFRRFTQLSYHSERGWELLDGEARSQSVTISRVHRFTSRWLIIHLTTSQSDSEPVVLVLCPDNLGVEEARHLKRYLLMHQDQALDNLPGLESDSIERS